MHVSVSTLSQVTGFNPNELLIGSHNSWCRLLSLELSQPFIQLVNKLECKLINRNASSTVAFSIKELEQKAQVQQLLALKLDCTDDSESVDDKEKLSASYYFTLADLILISVWFGFNFECHVGDSSLNLLEELLPQLFKQNSTPIQLFNEEELKKLITTGSYNTTLAANLSQQQYNNWNSDVTTKWNLLQQKFINHLSTDTFTVSQPYTTDELFAEIQTLNPDISHLLDLSTIKQQVVACKQATISSDSAELVKIVHDLRQKVKQHFNFYPRDHQLFVVFAAAAARSKGNLVFNVFTGEGKSIIVLLLAAVDYLYFGNYVDVITSQSLLAERDATDLQTVAFFNSVRMNCAYINEHFSGDTTFPLSWYKHNVCFGTAHGYECHLLGTCDNSGELVDGRYYSEQHVRAVSGRNFSKTTGVIDEVDSIVIDNIGGSTQLSSQVPGYRCLHFFWLTLLSTMSSGIVNMGIPFKIGSTQYLAKDDMPFIPKLVEFLEGRQGDSIGQLLLPKIIQAIISEPGFLDHFGFRDCASEEDVVQTINNMDLYMLLEMLCNNKVCNFKIPLFERSGDATVEVRCVAYFADGIVHKSLKGFTNETFSFVLLYGKSSRSRLSSCLQLAVLVKEAKSRLCEGIENNIKQNSEALFAHLPSFEKQFFVDYLPLFLSKAWDAIFHYHKGDCYDVLNGEIKCVDTQTGVTQIKMTLSEGVQQYLEAKHGLNLSIFGMSGQCVTTVDFINRYPFFVGLTGTAGDKNDVSYYKSKFNANVIRVPPYAQKQRIIFPDVMCQNKEDWINQICQDTTTKIAKGRVVLIICENKQKANLISSFIKAKKKYAYICSENDKSVVEKKMQAGTVIISTNMGGRGTDIRLSDKVVRNGGLHVCLTFLPQNVRIELQNIGRGSRKGEPGSAVLIINQPEAFGVSSCFIAKCYRSKQYKSYMENLGESVERKLKVASFYFRYTKFIDSLRSTIKLKAAVAAQIHYKWSVYYFKITHEEDDKIRENLFSEFETEVRSATSCNGMKLSFNPYLLPRQLYIDDFSFDDVAELAKQACDNMTELKFAPYFVKLYRSDSGSANWGTKKSRALEALKYCESYLVNYKTLFDNITTHYLRLLTSVSTEHSNKESFLNATIQKELDMINAFKAALEKGEQILKKATKFSVSITSWKKTFNVEEIKSKATQYWQSCGIWGVIEIQEKKSWWDRLVGLAVALFGIALVVGAFFAASIPFVGWFVAGAMTKLGVTAIIKGTKGVISGQFDLEEFLTEDLLGTLKYIATLGLTEGWKDFFANLASFIPGVGLLGHLAKELPQIVESTKDFIVAIKNADFLGMLKNCVKLIGTVAKQFVGAIAEVIADMAQAGTTVLQLLNCLKNGDFIGAFKLLPDLIPGKLRSTIKSLIDYGVSIFSLIVAIASPSKSPIQKITAMLETFDSFGILSLDDNLKSKLHAASTMYSAIVAKDTDKIMAQLLNATVWNDVKAEITAEDLTAFYEECRTHMNNNEFSRLGITVASLLKQKVGISKFGSLGLSIDSLNTTLTFVVSVAGLAFGGFSLSKLVKVIQLVVGNLQNVSPKFVAALSAADNIINAFNNRDYKAAISAVIEWASGTFGGGALFSDTVVHDFMSSAFDNYSFTSTTWASGLDDIISGIDNASTTTSDALSHMRETMDISTAAIKNMLENKDNYNSFEICKQTAIALSGSVVTKAIDTNKLRKRANISANQLLNGANESLLPSTDALCTEMKTRLHRTNVETLLARRNLANKQLEILHMRHRSLDVCNTEFEQHLSSKLPQLFQTSLTTEQKMILACNYITGEKDEFVSFLDRVAIKPLQESFSVAKKSIGKKIKRNSEVADADVIISELADNTLRTFSKKGFNKNWKMFSNNKSNGKTGLQIIAEHLKIEYKEGDKRIDLFIDSLFDHILPTCIAPLCSNFDYDVHRLLPSATNFDTITSKVSNIVDSEVANNIVKIFAVDIVTSLLTGSFITNNERDFICLVYFTSKSKMEYFLPTMHCTKFRSALLAAVANVVDNRNANCLQDIARCIHSAFCSNVSTDDWKFTSFYQTFVNSASTANNPTNHNWGAILKNSINDTTNIATLRYDACCRFVERTLQQTNFLSKVTSSASFSLKEVALNYVTTYKYKIQESASNIQMLFDLIDNCRTAITDKLTELPLEEKHMLLLYYAINKEFTFDVSSQLQKLLTKDVIISNKDNPTKIVNLIKSNSCWIPAIRTMSVELETTKGKNTFTNHGNTAKIC